MQCFILERRWRCGNQKSSSTETVGQARQASPPMIALFRDPEW
jgi:hypothetical protein